MPVLAGFASWYRDPKESADAIYAAMPGHVWGVTTWAVVCAFGGGRSTCVTTAVIDSCGCPGGRVIDLSPALFEEFAPLSAGLVRVTVEVLR